MKVTVVKHIHDEVVLNRETVKQVTIAHLRELFNLPEGVFIKEGCLMLEEEHQTSHTYYTQKKQRIATERDYAVLEIIKAVKTSEC